MKGKTSRCVKTIGGIFLFGWATLVSSLYAQPLTNIEPNQYARLDLSASYRLTVYRRIDSPISSVQVCPNVANAQCRKISPANVYATVSGADFSPSGDVFVVTDSHLSKYSPDTTILWQTPMTNLEHNSRPVDVSTLLFYQDKVIALNHAKLLIANIHTGEVLYQINVEEVNGENGQHLSPHQARIEANYLVIPYFQSLNFIKKDLANL